MCYIVSLFSAVSTSATDCLEDLSLNFPIVCGVGCSNSTQLFCFSNHAKLPFSGLSGLRAQTGVTRESKSVTMNKVH